MGETFIIDNMDDMCAMMCDNVVPKQKKPKGGKSGKIIGTMLGLAVGDALGVPVEFLDSGTIRRKHGVLNRMVGGGTWGQPAGTVSDDTMMSLAVAEGIVKAPDNPVPEIGNGFFKWFQSKPFDIGVCCSMAIQGAIWNGGDWYKSAENYDKRSGGKSGGNGALMRTAFVGAYYPAISDIRKYAKDICKMTHWNDGAQNDCVLLSIIINMLINGCRKEDIEQFVMDCKEGERYNLGEIEGYPFSIKPSGGSWNSMACALKCLLTTHSFEDAVVMAVNMGGDTDTIGAITGAMAGAMYGVDEIPKDWSRKLKKSVTDRIAYAVAKRCGGVDNALNDLIGGD